MRLVSETRKPIIVEIVSTMNSRCPALAFTAQLLLSIYSVHVCVRACVSMRVHNYSIEEVVHGVHVQTCGGSK